MAQLENANISQLPFQQKLENVYKDTEAILK